MKRILVTGAGSYIGTSFVDYLSRFPGQYEAVVLDMIGDGWKTADFSGFDAVYHVAGIAHIRETEENAGLYYAVNRDLADDHFRIAVLRPPMVYGEGCKGNYQSLVKFAKIMPFFPDYPNKRSMIHVDALSETVKTIVDSGAEGLFLPQDPEYVCTCHMVRDIAAGTGKKLKLLKILNPAVSLAKRFTAMGRKAFGDLYYLKEQA